MPMHITSWALGMLPSDNPRRIANSNTCYELMNHSVGPFNN